MGKKKKSDSKRRGRIKATAEEAGKTVVNTATAAVLDGSPLATVGNATAGIVKTAAALITGK